MKLANRTAIVTGAGGGIGHAIALAMAKEGANVVVSDIRQADCQQVTSEIKEQNGQAIAIKCDITKTGEVERMVSGAISEFGKVDILANCAGAISYTPLLEVTDEDWDKILNVNLKGPFICARAVAKNMIQNKWGRIINIASISTGGGRGVGLAFPLTVPYTASKGGIIALTKALALDLTPAGINVNAICPGVIDDSSLTMGDTAQMLRRIPKARIGRPAEVANLAVFLASEEADYISGAAVVIDGGWLST